MSEFIFKKLPYHLSSHAGLAFVGKYNKRVNVNPLIDIKYPVRSGEDKSDILKSYLAPLCLGKSDFDAIERFRGNAFFMRALTQASTATARLSRNWDAWAIAWSWHCSLACSTRHPRVKTALSVPC